MPRFVGTQSKLPAQSWFFWTFPPPISNTQKPQESPAHSYKIPTPTGVKVIFSLCDYRLPISRSTITAAGASTIDDTPQPAHAAAYSGAAARNGPIIEFTCGYTAGASI